MTEDRPPAAKRPETRPVTEGPMKGWHTWRDMDQGRFSDTIGPVYFRQDPDGGIECRSLTDRSHSNMQGYLHGGYLMAFIDQLMFAIARPLLVEGPAVTLSCTTDFIGAGRVGAPVDGSGDILRGGGKTIFLRGLVTQDGETLCRWSGILKKLKRRA